MKYLVIAKKIGDGYDAWVPRLPECRMSGATLDEVKANAEAAILTHLRATGVADGSVEAIVAEDVWKPRNKGDGLDDDYNQVARDFNVLDLEWIFDVDEKDLIPFDDVVREIERLAAEGDTDETAA